MCRRQELLLHGDVQACMASGNGENFFQIKRLACSLALVAQEVFTKRGLRQVVAAVG